MLPASSPHTTRIRSTIPARWSISTGRCRSSIRTASAASARISTPVSRRRRPKTRQSTATGAASTPCRRFRSDGAARACMSSDNDRQTRLAGGQHGSGAARHLPLHPGLSQRRRPESDQLLRGTGPMNNAWVLAHEFAHAMGLSHSGPPRATGDVDPNCKPNYPEPAELRLPEQP